MRRRSGTHHDVDMDLLHNEFDDWQTHHKTFYIRTEIAMMITAMEWVNTGTSKIDNLRYQVQNYTTELADRRKAANGVATAIAIYQDGGIPLTTLEACHSIIQNHVAQTAVCLDESKQELQSAECHVTFAILKLLNQH